MQDIFDFMSSDGFISVNKSLVKLLGFQETGLYCELISRYRYFRDKEMLTEDGWFFNTIEDLEDVLNMSVFVQRNIINKLVKLGLLEIKHKGIPCKRYFKLNANQTEIFGILDNLKHENGLKSRLLETRKLGSEKLTNYTERNSQTIKRENHNLYNKNNLIKTTNKKNKIISSDEKILKNSASKKTSKKTEDEKHAHKERDRELKNIFMTEIWERYPAQQRVGEKICFSKFRSAVNKGVAIEEILDGFNQYLKIIEINQYKGTEQYIKRLDNWFASESWKNPNRLMVSQYDKKMQHQMNSKYPSQNYCGLPPVFRQEKEERIKIDVTEEEYNSYYGV